MLEELPFSVDGFKKLSARSFEIHYYKHHAAYVKNLNALALEGSLSEDLEEVMLDAFKTRKEDAFSRSVFNNAGQHWNHAFFWNSLNPSCNAPDAEMLGVIQDSFGSLDALKDVFVQSGATHFGSGWVWIVYSNRKLEVMTTSNAKNPILFGKRPVLVCDIWEHAYYVDFLNDRKEFLSVIFDYFDWCFAAKNIGL